MDVTDQEELINYKMESDIFKYTNEFFSRPDFRVLKYKDALYRGQVNMETGKREGKGVMVYD